MFQFGYDHRLVLLKNLKECNYRRAVLNDDRVICDNDVYNANDLSFIQNLEYLYKDPILTVEELD